ncbi:MAG: aldo/keto reductase [Chloroflexota bacterium]|nr:MAG: aldo/keto reductase [Chloroflexota bacterium]
MSLRPFGQTGLTVHPICVGCAALGDMPETFAYSVSNEDAYATVRAAFGSSINFIDTANIYGWGESERRIGVVIRERGGLPPGHILATKADRDKDTNRFDGDQARRSIEESLSRLGLDHLQIVYLHDPEYAPWDEIVGRGGALDVLRRYREQGVIGHLGLAGGPIDVMLRYLDLGGFECVISHNRYTLLNREAEPLIAACHARGIPMVNAAPYGSGMLSKGPSVYPRYMYRDAAPDLVRRAFAVEAVCQRRGVPLAAAALQFSLRDRRIASTIVGMTKPERLAQTLALAAQPLPGNIWAELDAAAE